MYRVFSKKVSFPRLVVLLYVATLLLGALCSTHDPGGHTHGTKVHHSLSCLLACSTMVSSDALPPPISHGLPLAGALFITLSLLLFPAKVAMFRSRAPPSFS